MHFVQVIPSHDDWERMRLGIDRVNAHSAPHLRQTVEDVRAEFDKNHCTWCVIRDGEKVISDLIVKTLLEDTRRTLYVWLMFGERLSKWARFAMQNLEQIAIFNGCDRIKFHTTRDKWIHLVQDVPDEWTHTHVFTKKVTYGRSI